MHVHVHAHIGSGSYHGVALVFRWNLMHICAIGTCARKGPHGYDDCELNGNGCCIHCLF